MTEAIIKRVLDTVRSNRNVDIISVTNDYGARFIEAVIAVDGKPIRIDHGCAVTIEAKRFDGASKSFSGSVNEDGTIKAPITQWMLEIPNTGVDATISVTTTKPSKLSTTNFTINVQDSPHKGEEISPDDPEYDVLVQVLAGESERESAEQIRQKNEAERESAEQIRQKNEAERENQKDLFSNALKGKKSGGAVAMSDISPLEYTLDVRAVGAVKVKKFGKNLFNNDTSLLGEVTYMGVTAKGTRIGYEVRLPEGKYTISAKYIDENSTLVPGTYIYSYVNDKNGVYKAPSEVYKNVNGTNKNDNYILAVGTPHIPFVVNIKEGDVIFIVDANTGLNLVSSTAKFNNVQIQIEEGAVNTEYETYIDPVEYDVNADGTVEGVTSIYPTTTLMTDTAGAVIDVKYNRDINKAFAELYNAIISLGGNV